MNRSTNIFGWTNGTFPPFNPPLPPMAVLGTIERCVSAILLFILIIGGTIGNVLSLLVIRSTRTMHTTRDAFTGLVLADTVVLWINPLRYWIRAVSRQDIRFLSDWVCRAHTFASYASRDCATWVLCLMTLERFLFAYYPQLRSINPRRKWLAWSAVLSLLITKNSPVLWQLNLIAATNNHSQTARTICDTNNTKFRLSFFYLDITVYSIFPTILLLVCNIGLLRVVHWARRNHGLDSAIYGNNDLPESQATPLAATQRDEATAQFNKSVSHATRLLIPVCMFHLLTTLPLCIFSIVEAKLEWKRTSSQHTVDVVYASAAILSMLTTCNHAANCLIYFFSSRLFRTLFCRTLRSLRYPGKRLVSRQQIPTPHGQPIKLLNLSLDRSSHLFHERRLH